MVEYKDSVVNGFGCAEIIWGEMKKKGGGGKIIGM